MNVMLFCSPWEYYLENLTPIAEYLISIGHSVNMSYFLSRKKDIKAKEVILHSTFNGSIYKKFINGDYQPDAVILTQCWWEFEREVVNKCNERNIPFFLLEHAPQMVLYNKRTSKYRGDLKGAVHHFMWGDASKSIMQSINPKMSLPVVGSPRMDEAFKKSEMNKKYLDSVVFYTTSSTYSSKDIFEKISKISDKCSDIGKRLVIKMHPRFNISLKSNIQLKNYINSQNIELIGNIKTRESFDIMMSSYAHIYDFPSSLMCASAYYKKPMYSSFYNSEINAISIYSKSFQSIKDLGRSDAINYGKNFLEKNLRIDKLNSSKIIVEEIIKKI